MCHASRPPRRLAGFTLIELMIVVGVVGILAVIAYPSFQEAVRKSRRADAIAGLNQLQQLQERFRSQWPQYADAVASLGPATSPERHYVLAVTAASASGYSMRATASASSPQFADTKCRALQVAMAGGMITHSSLNAAGDPDTTNANRCWPQ